MQNEMLSSLRRLSDKELVARIKGLAAREREATAQIVVHLAELDTRDVHLREGYASLFVYCRDALGLTEAEAFNRIEVARAGRRFPMILEMLMAGAVHLTAVRLLAPHLTPENHRDVLESARGKTKAEVELIVAALAPRPDVPFSARRLSSPGGDDALPAPSAANPPAAMPAEPDGFGRRPAPASAVPMTAPASADRSAPVTPLATDRYRLQLTISGETLEKLRLAKDMLGHAIPSGDEAEILDRALTVLLADLAKRKFADTRQPRSRSRKPAKPGTRAIPAAVRRAVWARDRGRCAFIGTTGQRCNARRFLEFHHVDPHALGGEASVDLIALRCRAHNDYEGRLYFGKRQSADGSARVGETVGRYGLASNGGGYSFQNESGGDARPLHRGPAVSSSGRASGPP
jgi:hypothetical protein